MASCCVYARVQDGSPRTIATPGTWFSSTSTFTPSVQQYQFYPMNWYNLLPYQVYRYYDTGYTAVPVFLAPGTQYRSTGIPGMALPGVPGTRSETRTSTTAEQQAALSTGMTHR